MEASGQTEEKVSIQEACEKAEKFEQVIDRLLNRHRLYETDLLNLTNWSLAISGGTFLIYLTNFDKFQHDQIIVSKTWYSISIFLLAVSTMCFFTLLASLYTRKLSLSLSRQAIDNSFVKMLTSMPGMKQEELQNQLNILVEKVESYRQVHNYIAEIPIAFLIRVGWIVYAAGLASTIAYVSYFIIICK